MEMNGEELYGTLSGFTKHYDCKDLYNSHIPRSTCIIEGTYSGRHFAICKPHLGHLTAYIEVKPEQDLIDKLPADKIDKYCSRYDLYQGIVHGGMTYYGNAWWDNSDNRTYIGWDYGHCDDYSPPIDDLVRAYPGHKWTALEILMEIGAAIVQMDRMNLETDWYEKMMNEEKA